MFYDEGIGPKGALNDQQPITTDPWEQGVTESAMQNAIMATRGGADGESVPLTTPSASRTPGGALTAAPRNILDGDTIRRWAEALNSRLAGSVPRDPNKKATLTPEQQNKLRLDFFLNMLAAPRGTRMLESVGRAGLDVSKKFDALQRENRDRSQAQTAQDLRALVSGFGILDKERTHDLTEKRIDEVIRKNAATEEARRRLGNAVSQFAAAGVPGDNGVMRKPTLREIAEHGAAEAMRGGDFATARQLREMAMPKPQALAPGAGLYDETGKALATNTEGLQAKNEAERELLGDKLANAKALEAYKVELRRKYGLDDPRATALISNMDHLIDTGIATGPKDAFTKLRQSSANDTALVMQLTNSLVRSNDPKYRGGAGRRLAIGEAKEMLSTIRGEGEPAGIKPGSSKYGSAEDVRAAHRAGKIDRATALKELEPFGFEND
jgi:hypothetical protein